MLYFMYIHSSITSSQLDILLYFIFSFMCMSILLAYMSVCDVCALCLRALDPLELELKTIISCHMLSGTRMWVLWKN